MGPLADRSPWLSRDDGEKARGELLAQLALHCARRADTGDDLDARVRVTEAIRRAIDALAPLVCEPARERITEPPPRRVAVAMALALFTQPHLNATLALIQHDAGYDATWADDPLVFSDEVMKRALGLTQWELDDLREEVDRRAGGLLKQARVLEWTWGRFGLPEANPSNLFRVLFPGAATHLREVELLRRGPQLYAVVQQEREPSVCSLFLSWLRHDPERTYPPLSTFRARYVDAGLRSALARSLGVDQLEIHELLDAMITILPADSKELFLAHDAWRSKGLAAMTGLGVPYSAAGWLTDPVQHDELHCDRWLTRVGNKVQVYGRASAHFDSIAVPRAQAMMQQLYCAVMASVRIAPRKPVDSAVFDVHTHLQAVLDPLIAWAESVDTHQQVATALDLPSDQLSSVLGDVATQWREHADAAWFGADPANRFALAPILTAHLVALDSSLRALALRKPDPRWDHLDLLLLFTSHYLKEARLERLWLRALSDSVVPPTVALPPPEDIPGTWFWATWRRILDTHAAESNPTMTF